MHFIRNLELRIGSAIVHLSSGEELKFSEETITLKSGEEVKTSVLRYRGFIIWNAIEGQVC